MRSGFPSIVSVLFILVGASVVQAAQPDAEPAAPWWLGSKAGISREVLPPWTPVEVAGATGATVEVWGRTYEFGTLPLPCSVVTKDAEVLVAPVTLRGVADGKELTWTGSGCRTVDAQPDAVQLAATAESGNLRCEGTVTVEYDGMIRCDLRLLPKAGKVTIQRLTLEMPLDARYARYLHSWPGGWGGYASNSGNLPEKGYHRNKFRPFFWLGDEWRGLAWFCESERNFFNLKNVNPVEIERKDATVMFRVNLITVPQTIDRPLEYTFGFHATPVKPIDSDAWDYRTSHIFDYGIEDRPYTPPDGKPTTMLAHLARGGVRTLYFHFLWTDICAYPATIKHGKKLKKLAEACHRENIQLLPYLGYLMSDIAPEWAEYSEQCLVKPRAGKFSGRNPPQTCYIVCLRSAWQDFTAAHLEKLIEDYGIDGVYLDGTANPWGCANAAHGCGYKRPDGSIGQTYPIFATRSMMKRIYTIVRKHNPRGQVNVHQSTCMVIPTLSFATSYWDGEQFQFLSHAKAVDVPLDTFRCEFMGHNWGIPAEFLHYYTGSWKRPEAMAMGLLHDVPVRPLLRRDLDPLHDFPSYSPADMKDFEEMSRLWRAFDAFGRHQATWLPYWENDRYVGCGPEGVKTSIYNRPGKGFMAVVVNTGSKECRAEAAFDLAALKQPTKLVARDVLTGKELPLVEGRVSLPLGPLGFMFFRAEPQ